MQRKIEALECARSKLNEFDEKKKKKSKARVSVQNESNRRCHFLTMSSSLSFFTKARFKQGHAYRVIFHGPLPSERATFNEYISVQFSATPVQFHRELLHWRNLEVPRRAILQGHSSRHVSTVVEARSFIAVAGCLRRLLCDYLLSI